MSKAIKWILGTLIVLAIVAGVWYLFFYKTYITLQAEDRQFIEKSFLPDTAGRGYSDYGRKNIDYNLNILKTEAGFTQEELDNLEYFYDLNFKIFRKTILAKNREEFVPLFIKLEEIYSCYSYASSFQVRDIPTKVFDKLRLSGMNESSLTYEYFEVLIDKYIMSFYSFKEMNKIRNSSLEYSQCLEIKKNKSYE